nr:uncharacterized protein LOC116773490 [Danaus plexippus plexippus]
MKQLGVSGTASPAAQDSHRHHYTHHRPKSVGQQQNVYAPHHVSHHPPVYGANVYAPQVNSTNASLTGASMASGYPSSVTLTQYQPIINSYQVVFGYSLLMFHPNNNIFVAITSLHPYRIIILTTLISSKAFSLVSDRYVDTTAGLLYHMFWSIKTYPHFITLKKKNQ